MSVGPGVEGLLAQIADLGRDDATGGYRRFAFTRTDAALGEWFEAACAERGFEVTTDRCGNQWAWSRDPDGDHAIPAHLVVGSHLDSVPDGGAFDGPLGIASALAAVDLLRARAGEDCMITAKRGVGIVRFVDEEGARFGLACSGSRLLTGLAAPDRVLALRDDDGTTYAEAAAAAGRDVRHLGRDDETLRRVGAFVELHVEQGRALALPELDAAVGVAGRIRPHGRWRVDLHGRADHAGTTLLADRADPMLALAALVVAVRAGAVLHGALATVGKVDVQPNAVNAIASRVTAWIDVRADTSAQVEAVIAEVRAQTGVAAVQESWTGATELDGALTARVVAAIGRQSVPVLATGAGHDAGVLAEVGVPSSMIFVRNPTGVSHSPAEHAEATDCAAGVEALAAVIADLCETPR